MKTPLVSIIIPTFNRAHLIGETLDSVLAQTYTNWECIVVDDGSTDGTGAVMKSYCEKDARFQYHHRPKDRLPGGNAARNYGFELSKGEYVNWLDSDDLFSSNKIENQICYLIEKSADISTCKWGRGQGFNSLDLKLSLNIYKDYNMGIELIKDYGSFSEFFPSHVFLIKKTNIFKSGLWNEDLKINQDGEFFCRLLIVSKKIAFVENTIVLYRNNKGGNTSSIDSLLKAKHLIISWKLIEQYLRIKDLKYFEDYITNGKDYCYLKLNEKYYNLILKHLYFFKKQFRYNSLVNRIKRMLF
ncbi:glycosyltransferase family 2 protein [Tamlana haliotis]|uniref:Glycosyltransferase family 2 protein n=1 Tax=Pseudotamlana haliotis TaxID=2614804 RepID=A0A6N6MFV2_9FLAO|nr:glycosyltransferase family 2 protein [Tamlana haliotis]KAB1067024.1 glycosyltransferase family 2 protein [Tamlana haliotis]